ncbi:MAG: L,D-transpeptidase [Oscillospiraceae bacterium]|nr:L,D-transpeptidase [Oscillospiraceae bacterium]
MTGRKSKRKITSVLAAVLAGVLMLSAASCSFSSETGGSSDMTILPLRADISAYDGFVQVRGTWFYYDDGSFVESGMAEDRKGEVDGSGQDTWWTIRDSRVDDPYTGLGGNSSGWWYVDDGVVDTEYTGLITGTVNGVEGDWYVEGGQVQTDFTGLRSDETDGGLIYLSSGRVDPGYSGFAYDEEDEDWWYLEDGRAGNETGGLIEGTVNGTDGTWYVTAGLVNLGFSGIANDYDGPWFVINGLVQTGYTGPMTDNGVTYYVTAGKVGDETPAEEAAAAEGTDDETPAMVKKAQTYYSSTDYMLMTDTSIHMTGVFQGGIGNWELLYYWPCTVGAAATPTIHGEFAVQNKGQHFNSDENSDGEYTCWYWTRFIEDYMYHSVIYELDSDTEVQDGRLGYSLSHGCVRLATENAKWIYDNIPINTRVVVY